MKHSLIPSLILFVLFFPTAGKGQTLNSDSVLVDGNYRTFHFKKPQSINTKASLVFVLHGSGGNGKQMAARTTTLLEKSDAENFVLVYPDGYKKYWNECRKAASTEANIINIDEVAFFDSMIAYFKKNYGINDQQVFAVGTSGGGHMAYKLAMLAPGKFRAITAIIANLPDDQNMDCTGLNLPLPVMIINGTADEVNPYNGGLMQTGSFKAGTVRSTEKTFQYWAGLAGYTGDPAKEMLPDTDPADGKVIERYTYKQRNKPEVVLLKVVGGKHDYPNDIDVHLEAWEFFKRQNSVPPVKVRH
ncbi:MAG TPA: poly(3-hydroxybutyrate) depolymerase [Chryseosolibacter sp.]|nr:poly(3-hydroxybutyrate) depolymerase [Chryseosolibacter sp.]